MKKLILAVTVLCTASLLNAQKFSIGPSVGVGHAWLSENINLVVVPGVGASTTYEGNKQFYTAFNAGVAMNYSGNESWGVGMDIKYSKEGGQYQFKANNEDYDLSLKHTYIRVPIRATYYFREWGDGIRPKVSAGPTLGFLMDAESRFEGAGIASQDETTDTKDEIEKFDLGLNAGIGCNFRLAPNMWLNTDIVYNHGFMKVNKNDPPAVGTTPGIYMQPTGDFKNRNVSLNVGLLFGLGGGSDIETASKPRNL